MCVIVGLADTRTLLSPDPSCGMCLFQSHPASLQLLVEAEGQQLVLVLEKNE